MVEYAQFYKQVMEMTDDRPDNATIEDDAALDLYLKNLTEQRERSRSPVKR